MAELGGAHPNPVCADPAYQPHLRSILPYLRVLDGQRLKYASVYKSTTLADLFPDGESLNLPEISDPWLPPDYFPDVAPLEPPALDAAAAAIDAPSLSPDMAELRALLAESQALVDVAAQQLDYDPDSLTPLSRTTTA